MINDAATWAVLTRFTVSPMEATVAFFAIRWFVGKVVR